MAPVEKWIPFRWDSGPLAIGDRKGRKGFTPEHRQALERWHTPEALGFLKGSPVNCLLVSWAAGRPEDAEQQRTLGLVLKAARAGGMSVAGLITGSADRQAAMAAARSAGLDAVVADGDVPESSLPVIPMAEPAEPVPASAPATVISGSVWPGIQGEEAEVDFNASPTRAAWIDSNIFRGQLSRAFRPNTPAWFSFEPPEGQVLNVGHYTRAIADSATAGGRWPVSVDMTLQSGLAAGGAKSLEAWRTISRDLAFFDRRQGWSALDSRAVLGVVSNFSGVNQMIGEETLNLLVRRNLPFRVIPSDRVTTESLAGLKAVVYTDEEEPGDLVRRQLEGFAGGGGLLIATGHWGPTGTPAESGGHPRFNYYRIGKGRVTVMKDEAVDPFLVARDAHILLDRTNDLLRLYNNVSTMCRLAAGEAGKPDLLQIVRYSAGDAARSIVVWFQKPYKKALLWRLGEKAPSEAKSFPELGGITVELKDIVTYAAVELSRA